ncbi:MAG TPA: hypothetical protein VMN04_00030 [Thermoanaerobaculia bacterium]|nr:hypothetical protein [Thermoanaerobaculia bacterium]
MLVLAGAILLALGVASGLVLALAPFGLVAPAPGLALWVLFPLFTAAGYLLLAFPSRPRAVVLLSRIAGGVLLLLALLAALGLFAAASDALHATRPTLALWYVLALGLLLGVAGLSAHRSAGHSTAARPG